MLQQVQVKTNMEEQCHINSCCIHVLIGSTVDIHLQVSKFFFFFPFKIKLDCYTK